MLLIPDYILTLYKAVLKKRAVPYSSHTEYKKWLRYYLDFCGKYPLPASKSEQVKLFINKLREKKQTQAQQRHAAHAVSLFFEIQTKKDVTPLPCTAPPTASSPKPSLRQPQRQWKDGYAVYAKARSDC
jgi:hypothetical protein